MVYFLMVEKICFVQFYGVMCVRGGVCCVCFQVSMVFVVLMMCLMVKLKYLNSMLVGVDLLNVLILMMLFLRLMYLCQKFVMFVLIVMWCMLCGSMCLWYLVFWWLNMLVDGIDMMWVVMFCCVSGLMVFIVSLIFEFVVIRMILCVMIFLFQFFSMQLFFLMLVICVLVCGLNVRFWWLKIRFDG